MSKHNIRKIIYRRLKAKNIGGDKSLRSYQEFIYQSNVVEKVS